MNMPTRPSAEATRQKILKAARSVFLDVGFDGAKTRAISSAAGVHSNLVFHHFQNKETLWARVKQNILDESDLTPNYDVSNAHAYIESIINFRFDLFGKHSDLVKLIQWQQLTDSNKSLTSDDIISPLCWRKQLQKFQKEGQLNQEIDVKLMILYITYVTHAPFMQTVIPLLEKDVEQYRLIALKGCVSQFLRGVVS